MPPSATHGRIGRIDCIKKGLALAVNMTGQLMGMTFISLVGMLQTRKRYISCCKKKQQKHCRADGSGILIVLVLDILFISFLVTYILRCWLNCLEFTISTKHCLFLLCLYNGWLGCMFWLEQPKIRSMADLKQKQNRNTDFI